MLRAPDSDIDTVPVAVVAAPGQSDPILTDASISTPDTDTDPGTPGYFPTHSAYNCGLCGRHQRSRRRWS